MREWQAKKKYVTIFGKTDQVIARKSNYFMCCGIKRMLLWIASSPDIKDNKTGFFSCQPVGFPIDDHIYIA